MVTRRFPVGLSRVLAQPQSRVLLSGPSVPQLERGPCPPHSPLSPVRGPAILPLAPLDSSIPLGFLQFR